MAFAEIGTIIGIAVGTLTIVGFVARQFTRVIETKLTSHVDNVHRQMDSHTKKLDTHLASVDKRFDEFRDNHLNHFQKSLDDMRRQFLQQLSSCSNHRERTSALEAKLDSGKHKSP